MSWEHDLAKKIKDRKLEDGHYRDGCFLIGHVLSPHEDGSGELIISILDGQAMLTEDYVVRLSRGQYLREGMTVALIPGPRALRGGQRYLVMEIPGHGDLAGIDYENCHPIPAITGLRGELDALAARCTALEGRCTALEGRCTALEGRCTTLEGKVSALESTVDSDLSPKVADMWAWYQRHKDDDDDE